MNQDRYDDLVRHLKLHRNEWGDSSFDDAEGKLTRAAEDRLLAAVGDSRIIWASGAPLHPGEPGRGLTATVFTEGYIIQDRVEAVPGQAIPTEGDTRLIPWSELRGVTLKGYWPGSNGTSNSKPETVSFVVHLSEGRDIEVRPGSTTGRAAGVELFRHVQARLSGS